MDFSIHSLAGVSSEEERAILSRIIADPSLFYRSFRIPKRRGGSRVIASPYPSLASIQANILQCLLSELPVSPFAFAYVAGRNAINHAGLHLRGKELLKLDIKDFFPSISRQMVFESLQGLGVQNEVSYFISSICTLKNELPQGACTSPVLSNLVFSPLDFRLSRLAQVLGLSYSRYADDMAFSGERIPRRLSRLVSAILAQRGFIVNDLKTQLKVEGSKKILTGVSISSGVLKAPRDFKRSLRAQIYELEINGDDVSSMKTFDPLIYERVLGRINYLLQIEPGNKYALAKKRILSERHQQLLAFDFGSIHKVLLG